MLVADTSTLVSLATVDLLPTVLAEFDVQTTETVIAELEGTAESDDPSGDAARRVLRHREHLTVHTVADSGFESSRIDIGEGSCAVLARDKAVDFLLTDDLRTLPDDHGHGTREGARQVRDHSAMSWAPSEDARGVRTSPLRIDRRDQKSK